MSSVPQATSRQEGRQRGATPVYPEQVIGNYAIGETIGRGSFGKVKKGRHIHTGELVAIKILNREMLKTSHMDKKINREIKLLKLFSHPNICRLYEVISTPTDMYLIMEYVGGGELYDYIAQNGKVAEDEARYIFQQIVCAVEYCHHFRVVHRDLKPENILLGSGLQVKLIDFGLSNLMKDGEFLVTSCGSPNYAAPEVISGKLYIGPETDVWSCGVILYALLCGYLPFDESSVQNLFSKIKLGIYRTPSGISPGPRELIQRILVVDPLLRLTIPQIRDSAWFNQKLPMRLAYDESMFNTSEDRIIAVVASETARRLSMREKDVRRELERKCGPAYVAYNILLDARRRKEIAAEVRELHIGDDPRGGAARGLGASSGSGSFAATSAPSTSSRLVTLAQKASQESSNGRPATATSSATSAHRFQPRATARELNMGLMLTQSPAMERLLDHGDAVTNKAAYNTGAFLPASAHEGRGGSQNNHHHHYAASSTVAAMGAGSSLGSLNQPQVTAGSFCMTRRSAPASRPLLLALSTHSPHGGGSSGVMNRSRASSNGCAPQGESLSGRANEQLRVGSVARKHSMYTEEEEHFIVQHNCGWRVGLMTDWSMDKVLLVLYDVLREYHLEWKAASPFALKVRTTPATWPVMMGQARTTRHRSPAVPVSRPRRVVGNGVRGGGSSCGSNYRGIALPQTHSSSMADESGLRGMDGDDSGQEQQIGIDEEDEVAEEERAEETTESCSCHSGLKRQCAGTMLVAVADGRETKATSPPPQWRPISETMLMIYLFRLHDRRDEGYIIDFSITRNCITDLEVVLRLSEELIRKIG